MLEESDLLGERVMQKTLLAAAVAAGCTFMPLAGHQIAHADYAAGVTAYQRGDRSRALEEFRRAAEAGDARAQMRLGRMYQDGTDVLQDYVAAHMWYNLAASQGVARAAEARDALSRDMSPEQLAQAQELARQRQDMAAARPPAAPVARRITGDDVAMAQRHLNVLGFDAGRPDGKIGPRTRTALRDWQASVGLPVTGRIDSQVLAELADAELAMAPPSAGERAPLNLVGEVQSALRAAGYNVGPVDGTMGPRTRDAIRAYQRRHAMPATGGMSPELLAALNIPLDGQQRAGVR